MWILVLLNLFFNILMCLLLLNLVSATLNEYPIRYKLIILSILDGVLLNVVGLIGLSRINSLIIYVALFSTTNIVVFNPNKKFKFFILELISLAYILLWFGFGYLFQMVFFKIVRPTIFTYYTFLVVLDLVVLGLGLFIMILCKAVYRKKEVLDFVYDTAIDIDGKVINSKMLLDSGNMLYDTDKTGLPVLIINKTMLESKMGRLLNTKDMRRLAYTTLNGHTQGLPIIEPNRVFVKIGGQVKKVNAVLGITDRDFKIYDGLLHIKVC